MFVINLFSLCKHSKSANQLHSSLLFIHLTSYYFIFSFPSHFISLADLPMRPGEPYLTSGLCNVPTQLLAEAPKYVSRPLNTRDQHTSSTCDIMVMSHGTDFTAGKPP